MKQYERGRRFEWTVRRYFESLGFVVIRAAASKPVDLVALRDGAVFLIECKYNTGMTRRERKRMLEIAEKAGTTALLATKKKGERGFRLIDLKTGMTITTTMLSSLLR